MAFMNIRVFPNGTLSPMRVDFPKTVKRIPPKNPKKTPNTLSRVIFSDKKKEDKIKIIIGVMVTITDACIGDVSSNPFKNKSMFIATPNKAPKKKVK